MRKKRVLTLASVTGALLALLLMTVPAWAAGPANDAVAAAETLTDVSGYVEGDTSLATGETDEPGGQGDLNTLWYSWVAPDDGEAIFTIEEGSFDTYLSVFSGSAPPFTGLMLLAANDDFNSSLSEVSLPVRQGRTYWLQVDGWAAETGTFTLTWMLIAGSGSANDYLVAADLISGAAGSIEGTNEGAIWEEYEPGTDSPLNSVWYAYSAPNNGDLTLTLVDGTLVDGYFNVYTGPADMEYLDAVVPDSGSTFTVRAGETYWVQVDGTGEATGTFTLSWSLTAAAANDDFEDAAVISAGDSAAGTNVAASSQAGEDYANVALPPLATVWYAFTPETDGGLVLQVPASSVDMHLCVYTGTSLDQLTRVADSDPEDAQANVSLSVTAGVSYYIQVDGVGDGEGTFTLSCQFFGPPTNDNFADAASLGTDSGTTDGHTWGATGETDEPAAMDQPDTVWYTWSPTTDGALSLDTTGQLEAFLSVYTGEELAGLTLLASDWYDLTTTVQAGTTYYIQLDGEGSDEGPFTLVWSLTAAPANDNFANAAAVPSAHTSGTIVGTNLGATGESDEPGEETPLNTVWYAFSRTSNGIVSLEATDGTLSPELAVYTGEAVNDLTELYSDSPPMSFQIRAGVTYYLQVDGSSSEVGTFTLAWSFMQAPDNDDLADAETISGETGSVTGTNAAATGEPGEDGNYEPLNTVWYEWVAPETGRVTFDMPAGDFDTALAVYDGDGTFAGLYLIDDDDNSSPSGENRSRVSVRCDKDTTYWIQVDGAGDATGDFTLSWSLQERPSNDDFANAYALTGTTGTIAGTNIAARREPTEPSLYGDNSVWYSFTPSQSGVMYLNMTNPDPETLDTVLVVWNITSVAQAMGTSVAFDENSGEEMLSAVSFDAREGITYHIQIMGSFSWEEGNFTLGWQFTAGVSLKPFITSADHVTFSVGTPASFTVAATGEAPVTMGYADAPLTGLGLTFTDNGDRTATLAGTPTAGMGGIYNMYMTAANSRGTARQSFTLTINEPATIWDQTVSPAQTMVGQDRSLRVWTSGYPAPTVHWEVLTTAAGADWTDIPGANGNIYTIVSPTLGIDHCQYRAVVTNTGGATNVYSVPIELEVYQAATITSPPAAQQVVVGHPATFTVAASGHLDPSYQWQISTSNGRRWQDILGADSPSYTTDPTTFAMSGYVYRVKVSNAWGNATSDKVALTVRYGNTDLAVDQNANYDQATNTITWTWTVTNEGPEDAQDVVLKSTLANGTKLTGVNLDLASGATSKVGGRTVTIKIPLLASGSEAKTIVVTAGVTRATGIVSNTVVLTSAGTDTDPSNNSETDQVDLNASQQFGATMFLMSPSNETTTTGTSLTTTTQTTVASTTTTVAPTTTTTTASVTTTTTAPTTTSTTASPTTSTTASSSPDTTLTTVAPHGPTKKTTTTTTGDGGIG